MKASSILGSVILVLILMGVPLLVIPVHASAYALQFMDTKADFNQTLPVFLQMLLTFQPK